MNNYPTEVNGQTVEYVALADASTELKTQWSAFQLGNAIGFWRFADGWEWYLIGGAFGAPTPAEITEKITKKLQALTAYEATVADRKTAELEARQRKPSGRYESYQKGDDWGLNNPD